MFGPLVRPYLILAHGSQYQSALLHSLNLMELLAAILVVNGQIAPVVAPKLKGQLLIRAVFVLGLKVDVMRQEVTVMTIKS